MFFSYLFQRLPNVLPELAVYIVGIMMALQYMTRARRAATYALWGFVVLTAQLCLTTLFFAVVVSAGTRPLSIWISGVSLLGGLVHTAGIALVLAAVFAERGAATAAAGTLAERVGKTCVSCGERGPSAAAFCMRCGAAFSTAAQ